MLMHRPRTPQPGFGSITLLQKFTPLFKILDPHLKIAIENKFISLRQLSLNNFHSKRQNESHLPQLNLAIHFGSFNLPGRNLQQKL